MLSGVKLGTHLCLQNAIAMFNFAAIIAFALTFGRLRARNECQTGGYTLDKTTYRSTAYEVPKNEKHLCDHMLKPGWYRFYYGNIPEHDSTNNGANNPQPNHCGTTIPVWFKGSHPTSYDVPETFDACMNLLGFQMCSPSLVGHIKVMKCRDNTANGFYIYNLHPVFSCAMAYCAGNSECYLT